MCARQPFGDPPSFNPTSSGGEKRRWVDITESEGAGETSSGQKSASVRSKTPCKQPIQTCLPAAPQMPTDLYNYLLQQRIIFLNGYVNDKVGMPFSVLLSPRTSSPPWQGASCPCKRPPPLNYACMHESLMANDRHQHPLATIRCFRSRCPIAPDACMQRR